MSRKIANKPAASLDKGSLELTEEYIRLRAYELFEQRGREHGHDIGDWLQAEAEIIGKKQQLTDLPTALAEPSPIAVTVKPTGFRTIVLPAQPNAAAHRKETTRGSERKR